jgi:hypothetical protein
MGPDSTPRTVTSTTTGVGPLFKIQPVKGDAWICNDVHILSLKNTSTSKVIDIPLDEYQTKSKTFKHMQKQWRTGVDFPSQPVPLDPYIVGLRLGDGSINSARIHNSNPIICKFLARSGLETSSYKSRTSIEHRLTTKRGVINPSWETFKRCQDKSGKRIPREYLINDRHYRLRLLAGLIDTDGYLNGNCFEIITKFNGLKDDILFLARSLGLAAYASTKVGTIKKLNFTGKYWRISISGKIPTLVKKASKRKQRKDVTNTGFTVTPLGEGQYFGFTLDGDRRFLLGDFTVTHNTALAAQTSIDLAMQGVPTLWGSFEISNEDLICRMLKHMGKKDFSLNIDKFDQTFERLASLPLWFMRFHGATKLEDVIDAMDYAVSVLDVRHIIIDNLQFMIGTIVGNEKFDQQNRVIDMVRDFKKERQIHVSLLAHPRKYDANKEMTEMDLFGSVKLSQDADNVFVIDPTGEYMRFTIRKCRKMGAYVQGAGTQSRKHFHYRFDKASETAVEVDMHLMQQLDQLARQQKARQQGAPQ